MEKKLQIILINFFENNSLNLFLKLKLELKYFFNPRIKFKEKIINRYNKTKKKILIMKLKGRNLKPGVLDI